ncbi:GH36-type glycosyl hydrolase domain-containing protein [Shewanella maritima]|uniref:GH36-type glycosyl hydrolase domain-containing protein n=1 Tax=Shewanella maritima TaxID=2520507 RepID=UPI0037356E4C
MITLHNTGEVTLNSPTSMPNAASFLWNKHMMIQMNCRGYATAQFMQPEPAKYSRGPNIEATTFIQPEHPYYSHHPGRFFYIKDHSDNSLFSVPYEPVRSKAQKFEFKVSAAAISWQIVQQGLLIELTLNLSTQDAAEMWQLNITNLEQKMRKISVYSYFSVGYMSWMNQSAHFDDELNGIFCHSVAPYQKVEQYFANQENKDSCVLLTDYPVTSYETRQASFEGEGGLHNPDAIQKQELDNGEALYETPTTVMQFAIELTQSQKHQQQFIFAPVKDKHQALQLKQRYFEQQSARDIASQYHDYITQHSPNLDINMPDSKLAHYINHWLPRQVFYHGDVNRLSTDPQTRNYLQDAMGMVYIKPQQARSAFITAIQQQQENGAMPDGILLHPDAELKYINQVPHSDHCVWLIICLQAYLDETDDYQLLSQHLPFSNSDKQANVFEHVTMALQFLYEHRDHRSLSLIEQGDWCDPMNMVGYKGKGVSTWLTLATAYAMKIWAKIAEKYGSTDIYQQMMTQQVELNNAVNLHCWDGQWYSRGITDAGKPFGVNQDSQGKIYLNPQSFAMLSSAANDDQIAQIQHQVDKQLSTPFGLMMLAPSYTEMHEDIGRVTQKFAGVAENGSVYNHAAIFYIHALFAQGHANQAWHWLDAMMPTEQDDLLIRGQLPVFIPNYYRGAFYQHPDVAGKSSQLFNTGTCAWFLRVIIEQLFGLRGCRDGLMVSPNLPSHWPQASIKRQFRDAQFTVNYQRKAEVKQVTVYLDGNLLNGNVIKQWQSGKHYQVQVDLPMV